MRKKILAAIFFLPFFLHALPWVGEWKGQAEMLVSGKFKIKGNLHISLSLTEKEFTLNFAKFIASGYEKEWGPEVYEIRGEELFEEGKKVGDLYADLVKISREVSTPQGTILLEWSVKILNLFQARYEEAWLAQHVPVYELKSDLNPFLPPPPAYDAMSR